MTIKVDHVVIGAGIVGSCTAWQLSKRNKKVLLIEQFNLPHTRGSSHGQTRLTRSCYEEEYFAALIPETLTLWDELEQETSTKLIIKTGVWCLSSDEEYFSNIQASMNKYSKGQFKIARVEDFNEKFSSVKYSDNYHVMFDRTGGVIVANKALSAVQELFQKKGGQLWDGTPVKSVELNEELVRIETADGRQVVTPSLVVCAGAWTPEVFRKNNEDLSSRLRKVLQGTAVRVYYWKCKESQDPSHFPTFIDSYKTSSGITDVYGLRPVEYPGMMKVCLHGGVPCDPEEREKALFGGEIEGRLKQYISEHWPGLEPEPSIVETCMYTTTPDENFILDHLYEHKNVVLGCGFSGTGFKTAPVVGKILSQMASGEKPCFDVPEFKLSRFS